MKTSEKLAEWAASPVAFVLDLRIPTRQGTRRFGDVAQPFQVEWLEAMAPSFLAVANGEPPPTPKFWIEASKNCSKTTLVAALLLWLLIFSRRPGNGVAGAVDKDNAGEVLRACKELLHENPRLGERIEIQAWSIVGRQTGCVIEVVASDRKGSHGGRPLVTYIDECSHVDDASFEYVRNVLDNAAKTGGLTIITSNAGWTDTQAFELRELARTSPLWKFLRWDRPSPLTPPEELAESERRNSASRHRRLHFTVWGPRDEGDAIPLDQIERAIVLPGEMPGKVFPYSLFVAGVDVGWKRDRSAVCVLNFQAGGLVRLARCRSWSPSEFRGGEIPLEVVESAILEAHRDYWLEGVVFDPWQAVQLSQRISAAGLRTILFPFTPPNLDAMARTLLNVFADRRIQLFDERELISDLTKLQLIEGPTSLKVKGLRDAAGHQDLGCAFLLALVHANHWSYQINGVGAANDCRPERVYV